MGLTLEGKNLLREEQILSFKNKPLFRMEANVKMIELLPLKVNPFALRSKFDLICLPVKLKTRQSE